MFAVGLECLVAPKRLIADRFVPDDVQFLKAEVWSVVCHDRSGCEQNRDSVEAAYWTKFVAGLFFEAPEAPGRSEFRTSCLALGMRGCWTVAVTGRGGPASDLIADADDAAVFLADIGFRL